MRKKYEDTPLWNSGLSDEERLDYLLDELTLEEKFACLGTGCPTIERLGITAFSVGGEGAHGVQARHDQTGQGGSPVFTSVLPNPIGMSATWDRELIKRAGAMTGNEARGLFHAGKHGCLSLWAPTIDMERDPRWGRTEEGYGEDPYLTGEMAGAYVEGMQGDDSRYLRCAATVKHYYANNVEEGRTYSSSSVDLRNKHEYYLEPFRRVIAEHHAEGMMTAYNEINGIPCMLLKDDIHLAKSWGLGHVVCDGGDVSQTVDFHKYFSRHSETIQSGLDAEIDCFTDSPEMVADAAREAYEHKMITEEQIDRALRNHFRVMLRLGLFDREGRNPYANIGLDAVNSRENQELVRKVTAESVVLLKNDGILPLSVDNIRSGKEKLAVIGPLSDVWYKDWYSGVPPYTVTPSEGVCHALNAPVEHVVLEEGECVVKIKLADGKYLGILEDGQTAGAVEESLAESFQMDFWGDGKVTLQAKSNHRLLRTEDDESIGQTGTVRAISEEAFGWFVKEIFYLTERSELQSWDQKPLYIDAQGRLRKDMGETSIKTKEESTRKKMDESMAQKPEMCEKNMAKGQLAIELVSVKDGIAAAEKVAGEADTVLLFLGMNPMITCKEEIDRSHIRLPEYQQELLQKVCAVNKNVVVVLISSIPYDISWAQEHAAGILMCATGSMELGNGLADIIFGKESPAGRLNMTWYHDSDMLPPITDYDIIRQGRTYQYYDGKVLYPFGYGLTYSRLEYQKLSAKVYDYTTIRVSFEVKNVGEVTTDEVVQVYYKKMNPSVKRANKTLVAFERIHAIKSGEVRRVDFEIPISDLRYYDVIEKEMLLEPGAYEIQVGASSEQIHLTEQLVLAGTERGLRDGQRVQEAECFDMAKNHVLRKGHLGYTSVCSKNATDMLQLTYEKMYLEKNAKQLVLDFWKEHPCHIWIEADGRVIGECQIGSLDQEEERQLEAGQASGDGAFEAHQNWITRRREIGFAEQTVLLDNVPVQKEFTLTIRWQGMGKLCTYQFR